MRAARLSLALAVVLLAAGCARERVYVEQERSAYRMVAPIVERCIAEHQVDRSEAERAYQRRLMQRWDERLQAQERPE